MIVRTKKSIYGVEEILIVSGSCSPHGASQVALVVKNPPVNAGNTRDSDQIPGLGRSPGGGHGTHSSILAWRILWTEEHAGLQSTGLQRVGQD